MLVKGMILHHGGDAERRPMHTPLATLGVGATPASLPLPMHKEVIVVGVVVVALALAPLAVKGPNNLSV